MDWRVKLTALERGSDPEGRYAFRQDLRAPASGGTIDEAEHLLDTLFPVSLRTLLLATNGVMSMMSTSDREWFEESWIVWPVEEIVERNRWHRESYANRGLSRFLFFSTAGVDGIMFGFACTMESMTDSTVYAWYPDETDDKVLAEGLESFLVGWRSGMIQI